MFLGGEAAAARRVPPPRDPPTRSSKPPAAVRAGSSSLDCASASRVGPSRARGAGVVRQRRPPPRRRAGDVNLVVEDASSTGEVLADLFERSASRSRREIAEALYIALVTDTGRFQYANTAEALRLAAGLLEAARTLTALFQGVYENVQFAKLSSSPALERAGARGGVVISHLLRGDFEAVGATEPYSEGIIDVLRSVEGSLVSALIREPPRDGGPARKVSLLVRRRGRRERDRPQVGGRRAPRGRRILERPVGRRDHRFIVREVQPDRRSAADAAARRDPSGIILVDKPAGPTSFDVIASVRRTHRRAHGPRGDARPVRDGSAAPLRRGDPPPAAVRRPRQALPDRDRPLREDVDRRPRGGGGRRARPAARRSSGSGSPPWRASSSCRSGRVRGQDRGRARVPPAPARRRRRDAGTAHARARAPARGVRGRRRRPRACSSPRDLTSARSPRRSAATAGRSTARRSGRSPSRRPTRSGSSPDEALARLP